MQFTQLFSQLVNYSRDINYSNDFQLIKLVQLYFESTGLSLQIFTLKSSSTSTWESLSVVSLKIYYLKEMG